MRILAPLAGLALAACAHEPSPENGDDAAWAAVGAELAATPACITIQPQSIARTATDITVPAQPRPDGTISFRADARAALDAFAAIGFLEPNEERDAAGRVTALRYRVTEAGAPHFRHLLPEPKGTRSTGFCSGRRVLVERTALTPVHRGSCATERTARFTWRYEGLEDWLDAPPIAAAFPERVQRADASTTRAGEMPLILQPEGWRRGRYDYIHNSCGR